MKTITLHFSESIAEKLNDFLKNFSENDLKIETENSSQLNDAKIQLQKDYDFYKENPSSTISIDEAEKETNLLFSKDEN